MKNSKERPDPLAVFVRNPRPDTSEVVSESLNFENFIIESSKTSGSYSREWVEAEIEDSSKYFTQQIYCTKR